MPEAVGTVVSAGASIDNVHNVRAMLEVFNLFNDAASDIDDYFTSRLRGEPLAGVDDLHSHPAVPRTARLSLVVAF